MSRPPGGRRRISPELRSALAYFAMVFGAGFLLGLVRVPFLVPRMGERAAELLEMPLMFLAIYLAAGYVVRKYHNFVSSKGWVMVGLAALGLLVCAELLLAAVLFGGGIGDYMRSRDPVSGSVYLGMLVVFAAMPWLRRRPGVTVGKMLE